MSTTSIIMPPSKLSDLKYNALIVTGVTIGFVGSYEVTEGVDFIVNIEIEVLDGELGRDVDIRVSTRDGTALSKSLCN